MDKWTAWTLAITPVDEFWRCIPVGLGTRLKQACERPCSVFCQAMSLEMDWHGVGRINEELSFRMVTKEIRMDIPLGNHASCFYGRKILTQIYSPPRYYPLLKIQGFKVITLWLD